MIEIYDSLSQITLTKAQILEEVLENKFKAQQLVLPSSFESLQNAQIHETKLVERLNKLKETYTELVKIKLSKTQEKLNLNVINNNLLSKLEQLNIKGQAHRYGKVEETEQELIEQRESTWELEKKLKEIENENFRLVIESEALEEQIKIETDLATELYNNYEDLEHGIELKKEFICDTKKEIDQYSFEYNKAEAKNNRLVKEILISSDVESIKGLEIKIEEQKRVNEVLNKMCRKVLKNEEQLIEGIIKVKQDLIL